MIGIEPRRATAAIPTFFEDEGGTVLLGPRCVSWSTEERLRIERGFLTEQGLSELEAGVGEPWRL